MNKSRIPTAVATIACLLGSTQVAHSILIPSEQVSLATRDKAAIVLLACNRPLTKNDVLDARRILESKQIYVDVTCEPFGLIEDLPTLKIANCDNITGRWACSSADAARLRLMGREVLLSYDTRIDFKAALEIAHFAVSVRSFNGNDVAARIDGRCHVGDGKSVPFDGAVSFDFGCDGWSGTITKDCGGEECRLFFTQFAEFIV
jgi:hypothetical protein